MVGQGQGKGVGPGVRRGPLRRARVLFQRHRLAIFCGTDRLFAGLLALQWVAAVVVAVLVGPRGGSGWVPTQVWAALLGGLIAAPPIAMANWRPGHEATRHLIAVAQMLMGALLIHLTGGRIETHFHVFGSLAVLAGYRDWRVLLTASAVAATDHMLRGVCWPASLYGNADVSPWRWAEHLAWIAVEDAFLIRSCRLAVGEMRSIAARQAELEYTRGRIAHEVRERTDELSRANAELALAYDATIDGWARALDLRDEETEGHSRRVTEMAVKLARAMGLDEEAIVHIRRGAMLHDIGKMGIPDAILKKPAALTPEERAIMQRHPTYAYEWLEPIPFLGPALEIPYAHHERWDGDGYPRGLNGEQIPLSARIFAAVDIWDALRSDRPYRRGWPDAQVRAHLRSLSGTHLDPGVVEVFLKLLAELEAESSFETLIVRAQPVLGSGRGADEAGLISVEGRLAEQLRLATELNRHLEEQREELARANARLAELAETDELTGLRNRRHFREALEASFSFAVRQGWPLSVVLLDVDHFKSYNDTLGHPAGDDLLRALSELLRTHVRPHDVVARYGGEEFAIVLEATDARSGRAFAERMRAIIAGAPWPHGPVTVSFGVATLPPDVLSAMDLVEAADQALYQSKRTGRNRVMHYEELPSNGDAPRALAAASRSEGK